MPKYVSGGAIRTSGGAIAQTAAQTGSTVTIVESWEDQDASNYSGFDTGDHSFVTSPVLDGSYALAMESFDSFYDATPSPAPQKGDEFWVYAYFTNQLNRLRVFFGLESGTSETYEISFDADSDAFRLNTVVGGNRSVLGTVSATAAPDTWYGGKVQWDDGNEFGGADNDITVEFVEDPFGTNTALGTVGPENNSDHATGTGTGYNPAGSNLSASNPIVTDHFHITNR